MGKTKLNLPSKNNKTIPQKEWTTKPPGTPIDQSTAIALCSPSRSELSISGGRADSALPRWSVAAVAGWTGGVKRESIAAIGRPWVILGGKEFRHHLSSEVLGSTSPWAIPIWRLRTYRSRRRSLSTEKSFWWFWLMRNCGHLHLHSMFAFKRDQLLKGDHNLKKGTTSRFWPIASSFQFMRWYHWRILKACCFFFWVLLGLWSGTSAFQLLCLGGLGLASPQRDTSWCFCSCPRPLPGLLTLPTLVWASALASSTKIPAGFKELLNCRFLKTYKLLLTKASRSKVTPEADIFLQKRQIAPRTVFSSQRHFFFN